MLKTLARAIIILAALFLSLGGFNWSGRAEDARWGKRPTQFYQQLDGVLELGSRPVLGVAHNAGDASPASYLAIAHGADVVEIDVIEFNGELFAAHSLPPRWLPATAYRGATLSEAWRRSTGAQFVQLDLKTTTATTLRKLFAFIDSHQDGRRIIISARDAQALETVGEQLPDAVRLLSINGSQELASLVNDSSRAKNLSGVTIRADLLDEENVQWFQDHGLMVIAWTVNDLGRMNRLISFGVDAISTDNLAILDALHQASLRQAPARLLRFTP